MNKVENELEEGFYLPHHAVGKMSSITTNRCRLNDILMVGPTIQDDVFTLLLRFRLPNFVLTDDIEKMYCQVLVRPEYRKFQRIVWRDSTDKEPSVYENQTVIFCLAPAPCLATRCLHQLSDDEKDNFPFASKFLKRDIYVDDIHRRWLSTRNKINNIIIIMPMCVKLHRYASRTIRLHWPGNCLKETIHG